MGIRRRRGGLLLGLVLVLGWGAPAVAQHRGEPPRQQAQLGFVPGAAVAWPQVTGNRDVLLFYLAAQHRAAQQSQRDEDLRGRVSSTPRSPYHQSLPGGSSASTYFGRTEVVKPFGGSEPNVYSDRYKHFFGRRGG